MGERPSISALKADYDFITFKGLCKQVRMLMCLNALTSMYTEVQCKYVCLCVCVRRKTLGPSTSLRECL